MNKYKLISIIISLVGFGCSVVMDRVDAIQRQQDLVKEIENALAKRGM